MKMMKMPLVLGLCLCATGFTFAQFKPSHVPEKTTWLAQLDVKALRTSAIAGQVLQLLDESALTQFANIHAVTGLNLTNDIDTAILFGKGNMQAGAVLSLYGRFDAPRFMAVLGMWSPAEFSNRAIGDRSLLSWTDNNERSNLCFIDPTHAVFSRNDEEAIAVVKQVINPAGVPNASLAKALTPVPNRFFALQLNNMEDFVAENQQLVVLKGTDSLLLELSTKPGEGEDKGGLDGTVTLNVGTLEQANQLHLVLLGLQAVLTMQAKENPEGALFAQQIKVDRQEQIVTLRMNLSPQTLNQIIASQVAKRQPPPQ